MTGAPKRPLPAFCLVTTFAPATVTNLSPGFDFLDCPINGIGDIVIVAVDPAAPIETLSISSISDITASAAKVSRDPLWNYADIIDIATMQALGVGSFGLSLHLKKGLSFDNGLSSSITSTAAAVVTVNGLFGGSLSSSELVLIGLHPSTILPPLLRSRCRSHHRSLPPPLCHCPKDDLVVVRLVIVNFFYIILLE
uniref:Homoserine kinase-like n=1 Tax=Elaeis guineensis var. tenera TaxID=51953 RepID=A0A6I9SHK7_ELAGV|nr:homoserine kinase-like [Elaeis guineensis]